MASTLDTVLRLDDVEWNRRMTMAEGRANIFANRFQRSFVTSLTKFAGVNFFARFIANVITSRDEIQGLGEDTEKALGKMERGFRAIGNAVKLTFAQLVVGQPDKPAGQKKGFLGFMESVFGPSLLQLVSRGIGAVGELADPTVHGTEEAKAAMQQGKQARAAQKKQIEELRELASKLADENMLAGMTNEQRRKELQLRLQALRDPEALKGMSTVARLENAVERERLKAQIAGLSKISTANLPKPRFGNLTEIGGFVGRSDNMRLIKSQDEAVSQLRQINTNTQVLKNAQPLELD